LEKQGLHVPALHATSLTFQTFESNVLYTLRFMAGGGWIVSALNNKSQTLNIKPKP
jgi:hypothetical protein